MPGNAGRYPEACRRYSIFDDIEKGWATPSWEEVVERDPDVILILDYTGDISEESKISWRPNEFTKDLKAVKEGKILLCMLQ